MMMHEFTERTGFQPTADEYEQIEQAYYLFDGDKNAFCKAFVENGGEAKIYKARAEEIERLRSQMVEIEKENRKALADRDRRIASLEAELDMELEWKPCTTAGTNMEQARYEHLASSGRTMTDQEAKEFIADECGFSVDKITILHTTSTYEVNKHRRLRKAAEYDRLPVYESTDWNYVRFDCACFMYELVNGELRFYSC